MESGTMRKARHLPQMLLLEKPQGRLHPRQAELLLSGRSCDDGARKEVRRLLLCKRAALRQCCLLSGVGRLAAGHQNQPGTERRCGKWVSGKNCCADMRSCPKLRCRISPKAGPAAASGACTIVRISSIADVSFPDARMASKRTCFAKSP